MPAFGDRFINLAEFDPTNPYMGIDCAEILRRAVRSLTEGRTAVGQPPGGSVYLGPGLWPFGIVNFNPVVVPPEIELIVAPGAVIIPHSVVGTAENPDVVHRPALEIQGGLDAPDGMFISTTAFEQHYRDAVDPASNRPLLPVGWVSFPTRAIDTVHPEWWGAGALADDDDDRPAVDTAAMEAAIRSALFRTPWSALVADGSKALQTAPLAIEILTQVQLRNGVLIGGRAWFLSPAPHATEIVVPSVNGLVVRGRRGGTKPHIVGRFVGDEPQVVLLASAYPDGLRFQDLWLDAGVGFLSDLLVMFAYHGEGSRLDAVDCSFTGRALRLVWTYALDDAFRQSLPMATSPSSSPFTTGVWVGDVTPDHLSFTGCRFAPSSNQTDLCDGLWVHAPSVRAEVRDSTFSGPARAMVIVSAGRLRAYNCIFANTAAPWEWFGRRAADREPIPESGIDVLVWGALSAPVTLNFVSCTSTSFQFLAMAVRGLIDQVSGQKLSAPFEETFARVCSARVVNLYHSPRGADPATATDPAGLRPGIPPPIFWSSNSPKTFALTLIGVRFGAVQIASHGGSRRQAGKVAVSIPGDQRIYDAWLLPPGPRYEVWNSSEPCNIVTLAARTVSSP